MNRTIGVGIIGTQFMGRAHSQAYSRVGQFFNLNQLPVLIAACGIDADRLDQFCHRFGWENKETDYRKLIQREDVDLVDICTSNNLHCPIAIAAAKAGKHIMVEKPMACTALDALKMWEAAEISGVKNMIGFNYRRVPAIGLAHKMVQEGKIGKIYHFNASYYQDWLVNEDSPFSWRNDAFQSGSGAHGDLNAHIVDLARYLVGDFEAVCGVQNIFIKERKMPDNQIFQKVTADDATSFVAKFQCGASGTFCASRFATGRKNFLRFELFGSEGSLSFNLERLNELEYYDNRSPVDVHGFGVIQVTDPTHPYMEGWWPVGHVLGWDHTFVHEIRDLLDAISKDTFVFPNFFDGWKCQLVLDAVQQSVVMNNWSIIP